MKHRKNISINYRPRVFPSHGALHVFGMKTIPSAFRLNDHAVSDGNEDIG